MKLILFGPQGSGKGTQAKKLSEKLNVPHISTGDIFRENIRQETKLGEKAEKIINKGELVPDDLTCDLIKIRLKKSDCQKGYILDGFPRNLSQARTLENFKETDFAILVDINDNEAVSRISGRRSCKNGHVYHIKYNPPKSKGICDIDGEILFQRDDDKEDIIRKRLSLYHKKTSPLIDFYSAEKKIIKVDGMQPINKVFEDIILKLN